MKLPGLCTYASLSWLQHISYIHTYIKGLGLAMTSPLHAIIMQQDWIPLFEPIFSAGQKITAYDLPRPAAASTSRSISLPWTLMHGLNWLVSRSYMHVMLCRTTIQWASTVFPGCSHLGRIVNSARHAAPPSRGHSAPLVRGQHRNRPLPFAAILTYRISWHTRMQTRSHKKKSFNILNKYY